MSEGPKKFPIPLVKYPDDENPNWEDSSVEKEPSKLIAEGLRFTYEEAGVEFNKQSKILDVGSGAGVILASLRNEGYDAIGVDARPRGHALEAVVEARIESLPFQDNSFDIVRSELVFDSSVYEQSEELMVSEIFRVLKPGGIYSFLEPHAPTLEASLFARGFVKLPKKAFLHSLFQKPV